MAVIVYATPADLVPGWLPVEPPNALSLIRAASILARDETALARYDADERTGLPTAPKIIAAFQDAVCQQVSAWAAAKVDPDAGIAGQEKEVASESVPGGSVTYRQTVTPEQRAALLENLCPLSRKILRSAGLMSKIPTVLR